MTKSGNLCYNGEKNSHIAYVGAEIEIMGYKKQIGIIVPSSGIVTEMLFHRYAPPDIGVSTARVKFNHISFQGLSDMLDMVGGAAADLCCVEPNIIVFSSIMAGAINGRSITNIVEQSSGTPCITGFYAMLEAINKLGIQRPVVVSPHTEELNLLFKRKMLQNGVRLGEIHRLAYPGTESSIRMMEQISMEDILASLRNVDLTNADALILNAACTQGIDRLRDLERSFGIPVLQGDQVSLWSALRAIHDTTNIPELGRIFEV